MYVLFGLHMERVVLSLPFVFFSFLFQKDGLAEGKTVATHW